MLRHLAFAGLLALSVPLRAQDAADWETTARSDVEAAYAIYRDSHPGWADPDNPGFRRQLEAARDAGLALAERADSQDDYAAALAAFSAALSDGHAQVYAKIPQAAGGAKPLWPGFIAAWRGQQAIVSSATPESGWTVGGVVTSCDGRPFNAFGAGRIAYLGGRPDQDGQWWLRVPQLFTGIASDLPATRCTEIRPDGTAVEHELEWTGQPDNFDELWRAAGEGETFPLGMTQPEPGLYWIALPSFGPDEAGRAAYETLYADLEAQRDAMASARAVVIDLRGNDGGSSRWSRDVAAKLWGQEAMEARMLDYFRQVSIWWRVSEDNLSYLAGLKTELADQPDIVEFIKPIEDGIREALAAGETYWVEPDDEVDEAAPVPSPETDFTTPVYVITPGRCASACLDAVDTFTRFSNTTLIGAPTSADSTYLEVRSTDLPSGKGRIVVPLKVWRGRPRPSGFVYQPRIRIDDLEWSRASFLEAIEADLSRAAGD